MMGAVLCLPPSVLWLVIFNAEDENEVREKMKNDPWIEHGILKQEHIKRWRIFIDERK